MVRRNDIHSYHRRICLHQRIRNDQPYAPAFVGHTNRIFPIHHTTSSADIYIDTEVWNKEGKDIGRILQREYNLTPLMVDIVDQSWGTSYMISKKGVNTLRLGLLRLVYDQCLQTFRNFSGISFHLVEGGTRIEIECSCEGCHGPIVAELIPEYDRPDRGRLFNVPENAILRIARRSLDEKRLSHDKLLIPSHVTRLTDGFKGRNDIGYMTAVVSKYGYTMARVLGKGGFGTTLLVTDTADRPLAIKVIGTRRSDHTAIQVEIDTLQFLTKTHPTYMSMYMGAFYDDEVVCIMLEYVPGPTLRNKINEKTFNKEMGRTIMWQLLLGLQQIHHQGCAHTDIKPENQYHVRRTCTAYQVHRFRPQLSKARKR